MRNRTWIVLGVIVGAAALGGCGEGARIAQCPPTAIGGGPRAAKDESPSLELNGNWAMTQGGQGLIGHESIPLEIHVAGSHVIGHYHPDEGMIDGEIRGDLIEGSWKESDGEGTFVWKISADNRHFTGQFGGMLHSQQVPEGATWMGVKRN